MKKLLSITLAVLMIVSAVPMAFASEAAKITGVSFSGDVVTYDEATNTYIITIPRDTQEYVLFDIIANGKNLGSVERGEEIRTDYKIGFDWGADNDEPDGYMDLSSFAYDSATDKTSSLFASDIYGVGRTDAVYFCNSVAEDGTKNWEFACYIKAVYAPEKTEDEICPDCGRAVHEGKVDEYICLLITFIKLVVSLFSSVMSEA